MEFEKQFDERIKGWSNYSQDEHWQQKYLNMNWEGIKSFIRNQISQAIEEALDQQKKEIVEKITNILEAHLWGDYHFSPSEVAEGVKELRDGLIKEIEG